MKKIILLALVVMSASLANSQILYKISGNGLKKASYIVGTHHLVDESFVNNIPGIDVAMKQTKQVYGEVLMSNLMNPDTLMVMQQAMMLPEGKTIKDVIDPDHYEMLNNLFATMIGIPFENPQIFKTMGSMRPSALMTQIHALMYLASHPGAYDPTKGIDSYFQNQALKSKKTVGGLETCSFQIDLLLKSQSIEQETKSFYCFLENQELSKKELELLTEAYRNQNAEAIVEVLNIKYGNECDKLSEEFEDGLLNKRNLNWMQQMPDIMRSKPTLFVVGAGHLFNENGVINLLRNAGFTVEPMK